MTTEGLAPAAIMSDLSHKEDKPPDWLTVAEDRDDQESREVYALAGLALYIAQALDHGIDNSLVAIRRIQWSKSKSSKISLNQEIEQLWDDSFRLTLGQLIKAMRSEPSYRRSPQDQFGTKP